MLLWGSDPQVIEGQGKAGEGVADGNAAGQSERIKVARRRNPGIGLDQQQVPAELANRFSLKKTVNSSSGEPRVSLLIV